MLNISMRTTVVLIILCFASFSVRSQTGTPPKMPADVMRDIRLKVLSTPPSKMNLAPTQEYPHVEAIIMDWPLQDTVMTVMASREGDGSIYTTGSFGLLGGNKYDNVRAAAKSFVKLSEKYYSDAVPTRDFSYPQSGHVRFYLICYDGVRLIDWDVASPASAKGKYSDLFAEGRKEIAALQQIAQLQPKQTP